MNPADYFDALHVEMHGIDDSMVADAPTFGDLYDDLAAMLENRISDCHTHFDRVAFDRVCTQHGFASFSCAWLDSARVVRCAWPDRYARSGYGLKNVAVDLGIEYCAHDALEDAWAAGHVLLRAVDETGLSVAEWLSRVRRPIFDPGEVDYAPNPEGPLYGEVVCFTGALRIPRREAAAIGASAGCVVGKSVTSNTTLLVVGDQDIRRLAGHKKSSEHRKAEALIAKGQPIRILTERDFERVIAAAEDVDRQQA